VGRLILLFFVFVALEAMVVARVAQLTGWLTTLLLLLGMSLLGSYLVQRQGLSTWTRLNQRMLAGEAPAQELVEGLLLLTGGFLLILPGFVTDALGLFLLLPPFRRALAALMLRRGLLQAMAPGGRHSAWVYSTNFRQEPAPEREPEDGRPRVREDRDGHLLIEGEAERKDE